jgi:hypothetical protein
MFQEVCNPVHVTFTRFSRNHNISKQKACTLKSTLAHYNANAAVVNAALVGLDNGAVVMITIFDELLAT